MWCYCLHGPMLNVHAVLLLHFSNSTAFFIEKWVYVCMCVCLCVFVCVLV